MLNDYIIQEDVWRAKSKMQSTKNSLIVTAHVKISIVGNILKIELLSYSESACLTGHFDICFKSVRSKLQKLQPE